MALRIYVGSNLKQFGISQYQQFTSDGAPSDIWPEYAPQNVRDAISKNPGISHLFLAWEAYMDQRKSSAVSAVQPLAAIGPSGPPIKSQYSRR